MPRTERAKPGQAVEARRRPCAPLAAGGGKAVAGHCEGAIAASLLRPGSRLEGRRHRRGSILSSERAGLSEPHRGMRGRWQGSALRGWLAMAMLPNRGLDRSAGTPLNHGRGCWCSSALAAKTVSGPTLAEHGPPFRGRPAFRRPLALRRGHPFGEQEGKGRRHPAAGPTPRHLWNGPRVWATPVGHCPSIPFGASPGRRCSIGRGCIGVGQALGACGRSGRASWQWRAIRRQRFQWPGSGAASETVKASRIKAVRTQALQWDRRQVLRPAL